VSKFKVGDRVIVSKSPEEGDYSIEENFPFEDTITGSQDDDGDYYTQRGWFVKEDMLTLVTPEPDLLSTIRAVLALDNVSDSTVLMVLRGLVK